VKIALGNLLEIAKGLASIFTILDLRNLPAIDPQMPLAPGSDVYSKLIDSNSCDGWKVAPFPIGIFLFGSQFAFLVVMTTLLIWRSSSFGTAARRYRDYGEPEAHLCKIQDR
jgi:hypothetical protein